jgi:hypothetical protein
MTKPFWGGLLALLLSTFACQPVIAVGWNEFLFVFILIAILLGPPLYRFIRGLEIFFRRKK